MSDRRLIDLDELRELAHAQVRSLAPHIFPNGREECGYWRVGSIAGEPGQSLAINLEGPKRGLWTDFSAPEKTPERAGNMIQLVARVRYGGKIADAVKFLMSYLGLDHLDPERIATVKAQARKAAQDNATEAARRAEHRRRAAMNLYLQGTPIAGTPAERYLIRRGIDLRAAGLAAPGSLKYHPEVWNTEAKRKLPCLLAAVVDLEGRHIATHRTWIRHDGAGKAPLAEPKKALGSYAGGFIPLWKGAHKCSMKALPPGTRIHCSEGIEDGLTAALARPSIRAIAAISLSNIGGLRLPDGCPLVILAQRDEPGSPAVAALESGIARQQETGRAVLLAYPPADMDVKDINELATIDD